MYALIASRDYGGDAVLLAIARTLPAMQRKWRRLLDDVEHPYACVGILTPQGLINYYGGKIGSSMLGWITVKIGVEREGV